MTVALKSALDGRTPATAVRTLVERLHSRTGDVRTAGGVLAAAAVCALAAVRVAINAPLGQSPAGLQFAHAVADSAAVVVPGVVAVAIGAGADSEWSLVGLIAAGTSAVLATLAPVTAQAAGVLLVGSLLVVVPPATRGEQRAKWRLLFAGLVVAAVVLSLAPNTGAFPTGMRSAGTTATYVALVAAPVVAGVSRRVAVVGVASAVLGVAGALAAPFVAGAVFLAVGAAIDPPLVVAAAGVGGGVAVVAEGRRRRQTVVSASGLLLLAAGVPSTVPRALAVVRGAHLRLVAAGTPAVGAGNGGDVA